MIKKDWFYDLKIHPQIYRESDQQDLNTKIDTPNTEKQEHLSKWTAK